MGRCPIVGGTNVSHIGILITPISLYAGYPRSRYQIYVLLKIGYKKQWLPKWLVVMDLSSVRSFSVTVAGEAFDTGETN